MTRIKVKPVGGVSPEQRLVLMTFFEDEEIHILKIIDEPEAYIMVPQSQKDALKFVHKESIRKLKEKGLEIQIPMEMKARMTVVIR